MSTALDIPKTPRPVVTDVYTLSMTTPREASRAWFGPHYPQPMDFELAFTDLYKKCRHLSAAKRESTLLDFLFPAVLQPIESGDLLAGRIHYPLVGLGPEPMGLGYYCSFAGMETLLDKKVIQEPKTAAVRAMIDFWRTETTHAKIRASFPVDLAKLLPSDQVFGEPGEAFPLYRMAGLMLNYEILLERGLPGLRKYVEEQAPDPRSDFACALIDTISVIERSAVFYGNQARALAHDCAEQAEKLTLSHMADRLSNLEKQPPRTFKEALQLLWLYTLHTGVWNYGRLDDLLGPFLVTDLDNGVINTEEAVEFLCSFWRLIHAYDNCYNNRVIVGGRGRKHEAEADRFALLAMEATRRVRLNQPQLTLRFYEGQNPTLYRLALDVIGEGCTYPLLYNDDVNVPAVQYSHHVNHEEAVQYLPYGCGEYMLNHRSISTPNGVINLAKVLNEVLAPVKTQPDLYPDFESLWLAYARRVELNLRALARFQKLAYDITGQECSFLGISLLYDDCVPRNKALLEGGVRYLGGTIETYGNITTSDSLTSIRKLVYEQRRFTLQEVVKGCQGNFWGNEGKLLHKALLEAPKYGNDDPLADAIAVRVHEHVCHAASAQAQDVGLDWFLVVVINNMANTSLGRHTEATPDGRRAGDSMSNANNPTAGRDLSGTTAFLNSLVKLDPTIHAGAVQNMKFSRSLFTRDRANLEAMLSSYWHLGGAQAMITVVSKADLESAMMEPEKWGHLMVRVGGFSIRFIDLPREAQLDILNRTLHE